VNDKTLQSVLLTLKAPRISALDIHEWIYAKLHVPEYIVTMVQIDGPRRQVYNKFTDLRYLKDLHHSTMGQSDYKHDNGEISQVKIEMAGMGTRRVRIASLPPETEDETVSPSTNMVRCRRCS